MSSRTWFTRSVLPIELWWKAVDLQWEVPMDVMKEAQQKVPCGNWSSDDRIRYALMFDHVILEQECSVFSPAVTIANVGWKTL